jgi:hypothetical protein
MADREAQPVRRRPVARLAVGSLVASTLLAGCVPASPDDDTYKDKAAVTLGGAASQVATVQKVLELLHQGRLLRPTAIAQMRYSQSSLDTNTSAFTEVHPPPELDWLYTRTNNLLSNASDTTNQARLAIERHDVDQYPKIADDLTKLADKLDELESRVS